MIEVIEEKPPAAQLDLFAYVCPEKEYESVRDGRDKAKSGTLRQIVFLLDGDDYIAVYEKLQSLKTKGETNSDCILRILNSL